MAIAEREIPLPAASPDVAVEESRPAPWRCTRDQFHQMREEGLFEGQRVILIEGEILVMPPVGTLHSGIVTLASEVLRPLFGAGFFVREEKPFDVGKATDPQPDIAVIAGTIRDFLYRGLTEAALVVEVSHSTLSYDRREKASLYASAGVADYWIINIDQEPAQIEVHRQPVPDETQPHSFGYRDRTIHQAGEIIQPLAAPGPVAVSALLP